MSKKTWLITGCSTGIGRALAKVVADQGDQVIATVRNEHQIAEVNALNPQNIDTVLLDVKHKDQIHQVVKNSLLKYNRIDVLVNNAGYGSIGPIEGIEPEEVRRQFDVNVFGPIQLIKESLGQMRKNRSGHIINITSIAGLRGSPGLGIYNGSKFALEGVGEALHEEVKHLGINVTNIEPGPFKTKWAGASATYVPDMHEDYKPSAGQLLQILHDKDGNQPGDPDKAAKAIFDLTRLENPPVHMPLGAFAYEAIYSKLDEMKSEINAFEFLGKPTDFS